MWQEIETSTVLLANSYDPVIGWMSVDEQHRHLEESIGAPARISGRPKGQGSCVPY